MINNYNVQTLFFIEKKKILAIYRQSPTYIHDKALHRGSSSRTPVWIQPL